MRGHTAHRSQRRPRAHKVGRPYLPEQETANDNGTRTCARIQDQNIPAEVQGEESVHGHRADSEIPG